MGIDIADPATEQHFTIDELEHLIVRGDVRLWEAEQVTQSNVAMSQIAERESPPNERMPEDLTSVEQVMSRSSATRK